jgi:pimeloyl-ACP methyl ester carboxylesterase
VIETSTRFKTFPERVLELGEGPKLVAIRADADPRSAGKPTVVLLNAGVLHRVGPRRLHVLLARELAARGFSTCRVDLSGIGDSRPINGHLSFRESAVADTRAVMDELAREPGTNRFVLFGLCSGADNALAAAARDPRIAAVILVDAHSYPTVRAYGRELLRRSRQSGVARTAATAAAAGARFLLTVLMRGRRSSTPAGREPPPKPDFRRSVSDLMKRGTKILFIYSANMHVRFNHKDQLFELFPELRDRVDVAYFGNADHVFTELSAQKRLIDTVTSWISRAFG